MEIARYDILNSLFSSKVLLFGFFIFFILLFTGNNFFFENNFKVYGEKFYGNAPNNNIEYPFLLEYPDGWNPVGHNLGVTFSLYETSESDSKNYVFPVSFDISYFKKGETTIKELIKNQLTSLKQPEDNKGKAIIQQIAGNDINPKLKFTILFSLQYLEAEFNFPVNVTSYYATLENSDLIVFSYYAIPEEFAQHKKDFLEFIKSFKSKTSFKDKVIHGFPVSNNPQGFAINTKSNTLYIANSFDDSVSVVDSRNQEIKILKVENYPFEIVVDESTNKIYVLNYGSSSISIINGRDNTLENTINVSSNPTDIAINENLKQVYVAHSGTNNVTIIDNLNQDKKEISIAPPSDDTGIGIAVDELENKIYVTNPAKDRVDVIDPNNLTDIVKLPPYLKIPIDITIDPILKKAYILDDFFKGLLVMDISNNKTLHQKPQHIYQEIIPNDVEFNPINHKIYVSNTVSDTITELDPFIYYIPNYLETDHVPIDIEVNWRNNIIYVTNQESKSISMIDGDKFENLLGVSFNIHPSNGGRIVCDEKQIQTQTFNTIKNNSECIITPNKNFYFSQINLESQKRNASLLAEAKEPFDMKSIFSIPDIKKINLTDHGTYDVYFTEITLPSDYWLPFYGLIPAFFIPGIVTWISKYYRKRKLLKKILDYKIKELNKSKHNRAHLLKNINEIRDKVRNDFYSGKIDENEYKIILEDLSSLENDNEERY